MEKVTIPALHQMKRDGRKIVGVVAWDYQIAKLIDRAGVEIISVGDTVGINLWGQPSPLEVTMDQMVICCQAVRRGTERALVSVDFPFGPLQEGVDSAVRAAIRLVKEAGADMIKLDGAAAFRPERSPGLEPRQSLCRRRHEDGSGKEDEGEDPAVVHPHRVRLAVGCDSRQRERDPVDGGAGAASEGERDEALDAVVVEHDPGGGGETGKEHADPRVGEEQGDGRSEKQQHPSCADERAAAAGRGDPQRHRNCDVAEQGQLVPVGDRRAEAGDAAVVGVQGGDALGEQRPAEDEAEQRRRGAGKRRDAREDGGEQHPEEGEGGIDERAVRVRPRAVRGDRPERREPGPGGEAEETAEEGPSRHVEPGRRQRAVERRGGRERRQGECETTDPDERGVVEAATPEERSEAQSRRGEGRRGESGREAREPFADRAHGRSR